MKVTFSSGLKVELLVCNAEGRSRPRGNEPVRIHQPPFRFVPKFTPKMAKADFDRPSILD
jgi:hypothetical protein